MICSIELSYRESLQQRSQQIVLIQSASNGRKRAKEHRTNKLTLLKIEYKVKKCAGDTVCICFIA